VSVVVWIHYHTQYATLLQRASEHFFCREMASLLNKFAGWEINLPGLKV